MSEDSQKEPQQSSISGPPPEQTFAPSDPFPVRALKPGPGRRQPQPGKGRRSQTVATQQGGHAIRAARPTGSVRDVAVEATLRAAALRSAQGSSGAEIISLPAFQPSSQRPPAKGAQSVGNLPSLQLILPPFHPSILPTDLRIKIRRARTGHLILFVVDASGSMGARKRMIAVKGAILSLLLDAYQKRDRVGLIAFRGPGAELLVPPTNSVELAEQRLRHLPTGGRTPLAAGLHLAGQVLTQHLLKEAALTPLLVLVTDGRSNVGSPLELRQAALALSQKRVAVLVLDSDQSFVRIGAAQEIAAWLEAEYLRLDDLRAGVIAGQVRQQLVKVFDKQMRYQFLG